MINLIGFSNTPVAFEIFLKTFSQVLPILVQPGVQEDTHTCSP